MKTKKEYKQSYCMDCVKKITFKEYNKYGGICERCASEILNK